MPQKYYFLSARQNNTFILLITSCSPTDTLTKKSPFFQIYFAVYSFFLIFAPECGAIIPRTFFER